MSRDLRTASEQYSWAAGELLERVRAAFLPVALEGEADAKANATQRPKVRGGALRRSIRGWVATEGGAAILQLDAGREGSPAEGYAAIQEHGGLVRPRKGKWLAMPVNGALTASGVPRYRSPRDVADLRYVPLHGAKALLVRETGNRNARSEILWVLLRRVQVPATRFLGRAWDTTRPRAVEAGAEAVRRMVGGLDGG